MTEKILIACYDFPPNTGIGGRRWAKFAKGLAQLGHEVYVIKADPAEEQHRSDWADDIAKSNITVTSLPRRYPRVISHGPKNLIDKFSYRYHLKRLKKKEKGTIYDIAIGWENDFLNEAHRLIEDKRITKVIATGAPFNLLYYAAKLKKSLPHIKLLCDYRDPWLNAANYGMADLTPERRKHEEDKQTFIMEWADIITAPNRFLLDEIKATTTTVPKARLEELPHFFDADDIKTYLGQSSKKENGLKLVYGGSLYIGLESILERFAEDWSNLQKSKPDLTRDAHVDVYTPHVNFARYFALAADFVDLHPFIGKDIFKKIQEADAVLIFLAEHNKNFLTTKFFEYLPFKKPLIFVGAEGHASSFIADQKLGLIVRDVDSLQHALEQLKAGTAPAPTGEGLDSFSLLARTELLLKLMA